VGLHSKPVIIRGDKSQLVSARIDSKNPILVVQGQGHRHIHGKLGESTRRNAKRNHSSEREARYLLLQHNSQPLHGSTLLSDW